jgi:hypothetical protein
MYNNKIMEQVNISVNDKIGILDWISSNDFSKQLKGVKGVERREYIERMFGQIQNLDLVIQIYNDEAIEEDYNLNLKDI